MPVIIYAAGIARRTQKDISELDRTTSKSVNICGGLHPCSGIRRPHVPRIKVIIGLRQMEYVILAEK